MKKLKKPLVIVSILILIILLELNCFQKKNSNEVSVSTKPPTKEVQHWIDRIKQEGGYQAYIEFKEQVKNLDPGQQHAHSHLFGEGLYRATGIDGVSICDNSFAFGCYHSFLGTAIHIEGLTIVPLLNQKCIDNLKDQSLGCQHGIGHGIATDFGYKYDDLVKSLDICDKLPVNDPIGGCTGGVFMEYNFQTMLSAEGQTRQFDPANPLFPCQSLQDKYRQACYFWQGQWWATVLPASIDEKYSQIGLLCQKIENSNEQLQCFLGSGNTIGQFSNWKIDRAKELCSRILTPKGNLGCRSAAAGAFMAEPSTQNIAQKLCEGFNQQDHKECLRLAHLSIGNQEIQ